MRKETAMYWDAIAARSDADARDVILIGFRDERAFDESGREDAGHLVLPFVSKDDVIMEVGCGNGRLLKWVAPACKEAIGLDTSPAMLKRARERLQGIPNVRLKRIPVSLRFPIPDRSVDFAYVYHVSEHLEREDFFTLLAETRRCLKRAGSALVQFSLIEHPSNQRELLKWVRKGDTQGVRSRYYTESEVLTLLGMLKLYPQIRLYIPGEFVVVVTKQDGRTLGNMPLVSLKINS
jgi:SAM-dependent methyltransferase